jgi:2-iminobutanoate/2-iminopropanoate deaminase
MIMRKRAVHTHGAPAAVGPYSQAIALGNLIFTSGQVALNPEDGTLLNKDSIEDETRQVMRNLQAILDAAGLSLSDVVKSTIYLTDVTSYPDVNNAYGSFFEKPYPARECVGVNQLPLGARVEISMIAATGNSVE